MPQTQKLTTLSRELQILVSQHGLTAVLSRLEHVVWSRGEHARTPARKQALINAAAYLEYAANLLQYNEGEES